MQRRSSSAAQGFLLLQLCSPEFATLCSKKPELQCRQKHGAQIYHFSSSHRVSENEQLVLSKSEGDRDVQCVRFCCVLQMVATTSAVGPD